MEGSDLPFAVQPRLRPLRGYINLPAIGGLNVNLSGNIALDNIFFARDGKLVTLLDIP